MKRLAPIRSLAELASKARKDDRYKNLALKAAENLGGNPKGELTEALQWLNINADESGDEDGVVDEVNFCLDLVV